MIAIVFRSRWVKTNWIKKDKYRSSIGDDIKLFCMVYDLPNFYAFLLTIKMFEKRSVTIIEITVGGNQKKGHSV